MQFRTQKRMPPCPHPCIQSCHFGVCDPCKAPLKRLCYCGTLVRSFDCSFFNSLTEEERDKQRSCGGPCHRSVHNVLLCLFDPSLEILEHLLSFSQSVMCYMTFFEGLSVKEKSKKFTHMFEPLMRVI